MKKAIFGALLFGMSSSMALASTVTVNVPQPSSGTFDLLGTGDASVTYDGVTFSTSSALSDGNFWNVGTAFSGNAPVVSSQQQTHGSSNILITLPSLASNISVNFGTFGGSLVTFLLSSGASSNLASTGSGYATPDIYMSGNGLFSSLLLTSNDGVLNVSSVTYTEGSAAPEPGTWLLMIGGFGAIGALQRSRKLAVSFAR